MNVDMRTAATSLTTTGESETTHLVHSCRGAFRVHESTAWPLVESGTTGGQVMGTKPRRRLGQAVTCAWCRRTFPLLRTGRLPRYCGDTCRHRAWEHRRAIASTRTAVEVVIQTVEVERPLGAGLTVRRNGAGWAAALTELARDLDRGRVYDRDLPELAQELQQVPRSLERRPGWARRFRTAYQVPAGHPGKGEAGQELRPARFSSPTRLSALDEVGLCQSRAKPDRRALRPGLEDKPVRMRSRQPARRHTYARAAAPNRRDARGKPNRGRRKTRLSWVPPPRVCPG